MRRKRTILMLVAVMLLCAMAVSAAAANLAEPAVLKRNNRLTARELADIPETPEVTVEGNLVSNDNGKTCTGYFELSVYVSAKGFQSVGVVLSYDTAVLQPVDWTAGDAITVAGKTWDSPTVLHTKGADALSGKPALAYTEYETAEGEDGAAETEQATGRANLYLGADALKYTDLLEERVVTVRFKLAEKADGSGYAEVTMPTADAAANGWSEPYTVQLADSAVAQAAIPGSEVFVTVKGEDDVEPKAYAYQADGNGVEACATQFRIVSQKSIVQSGSVVSGDYAITFFDWDGRVIDAVAAPEDAADVVASWEQHTAIQARLGNKPGYEFDRWLVVYEDNDGEGLHTVGGTFTSNDTAVAAGNPDVADLSDISGYVSPKDPDSKSVLLQACYKATEDINTGIADATASNYTVKPIKYTRYGGASADDAKYSITLEVTRLNTKGMGVTRARTPGVVVKMQPTAGGNAIFTLLSLENTDVTTCEMVPNKQIASVEYYFIDSATAPKGSWPDAGNRSPLGVKIDQNGDNGFKVLGTVGYINQMAREMTWDEFKAAINAQTFTDAGLTYSTIETAQERMYNAVRGSSTDLSKKQLQTAIGNG
ncbi:MAG: hypothetical protein HFF09_07845 [Oscillospiraceae bacterium]|nr:hypothetical protein [Oscillospiraceae bacterium]